MPVFKYIIFMKEKLIQVYTGKNEKSIRKGQLTCGKRYKLFMRRNL